MNDNAVAVYEKPHELSVVEVKAQVVKVQELMKDLMQEGTHYGESYPGDTKKNLLKPGADKLCFMFRLRPDFTQEVKELPNGHMEVISRCQIFHIESGQKIAEGVGLASTMESKYRWRNAAKKCPACGKETIIKGKEEYGGGFICYAKKGGCGAKYADNDPKITEQPTGKVENPDIADTYNTVIKISKKRAYVDATITACAASDIFTQDAEDLKNNTESLAQEAAQENDPPRATAAKPESRPSTRTAENTPDERTQILNETACIMKSMTPDETPFFTEAEMAMERAIIKGADGITKLINQRDRLRKELEKRKVEYKPIPFGDDNPKPEIPPPASLPQKPEPKSGKPSLSEEFKNRIRENSQMKQAPAADTTPAMFTEPEEGLREADDGFEDDIPGEGAEKEAALASEELDIF